MNGRVDAERLVLAHLLDVPGAFGQLPEGFTETAFEFPEHREIFRLASTNRKGDTVDREAMGDTPHRELIIKIASGLKNTNGSFPQLARQIMHHGESLYPPMTSADLERILALTIKADDTNKVVTFLGLLSAYTEDGQLNISFNAPSASGKSYIPTEIARLFPAEDVKQVGYTSPTAFFHDATVQDEARNVSIVDLERKIMVFLDQPTPQLLERLRPVLSHDTKELESKITDRSKSGGNRTKNVIIRGYPAVVFCSASLKFDEQEATRMILLSPETSQQKLKAGIKEKIRREADPAGYSAGVESNPERIMLKERIHKIKAANIKGICLHDPEGMIAAWELKHQTAKPRHQRDVGRIASFAKCFALLNYWHRERDGDTITTNAEDYVEAFRLWEELARSQELNLPPYIFELYENVFLAAYRESGKGLTGRGITRRDLGTKHLKVYGRPIADWQLRSQILPMLENAGLIYQEGDPEDRRRILIHVVGEKDVA